jgi:2-succinyl-5-enolpyruvyl-6-hydroxy-3-cyclohexene-1-carboxylate synthase
MLVDELVRLGSDTFFVAPGSRSTPLTVAAAQHPEAQVVLHVDERGNAFAALGWGRATGRPAAWITTSGTAVANGLPAAVEASVDGVPVVLLTADRPPELRGTGANQTIDQVKIFGDYVRHQVDVPPPTEAVDPAYVLTTVDQAVHRARRGPPGPVHLNCSFRKPLEPVGEGVSGPDPAAVEAWAATEAPFTSYPIPSARPPSAALDALADALEGGDRGLVVAGRLRTDAEARAVERLSTRLGWPLLPDVTSRLRLGPTAPLQVPYADLVLTADPVRERLAPEAVLHVGGRFVSKRLRRFLREAAPAVRAVVRPSPARVDPDHRVTHHLEADVEPFVEEMVPRLGEGGDRAAWAESWTTASTRVADVLDDQLDTEHLTEPALAALLPRLVPSNHALVTGNSMPVRDVNRHASTEGPRVPAYANRGASGIDGTVATAAGLARGRAAPVTLLLGDLALWHDLNSLSLVREQPVVIVVVNNDGGGIFHFLPIREHESVFEPYFTTPQARTFRSAAATFGLPYAQPDSPDAFRAAYREACARAGPSLIEVQTDREANRTVHDQLERRVAAALEASDGGAGPDAREEGRRRDRPENHQ